MGPKKTAALAAFHVVDDALDAAYKATTTAYRGPPLNAAKAALAKAKAAHAEASAVYHALPDDESVPRDLRCGAYYEQMNHRAVWYVRCQKRVTKDPKAAASTYCDCHQEFDGIDTYFKGGAKVYRTTNLDT